MRLPLERSGDFDGCATGFGETDTYDFGDVKLLVVRFRESVVSDSGKGFLHNCVNDGVAVLNDDDRGINGFNVWIDNDGDIMYLHFKGERMGGTTGVLKGTGTLIDATGKYRGMELDYNWEDHPGSDRTSETGKYRFTSRIWGHYRLAQMDPA
ncbi:hypothetical protein ACFL3S_12790 [Gemmatimonadota bacterium]